MDGDADLSDIPAHGPGSSRANSAGFREAVNSIASPSAAVRTPVDAADSPDAVSVAEVEDDERVEGISEGMRKLSIDKPANRYHGKFSTLVLITAVADLRKQALESRHGQLPPPRPRQGTRRPVSGGFLNGCASLF